MRRRLHQRLRWRRARAQGTVFAATTCTRLPDGTLVAVCCELDGWLQMWELAAGTPHGGRIGWPVPDVRRGQSPRLACTRLPDGTPIAVTGGNDGVLRVWDLSAGRLLGEASTGDQIRAISCTRLPDGTAIAVTGSRAGTVRCWDLANLHHLEGSVACDGTPQLACARLADDTPVVVVGHGTSLRVWEPIDRRLRGEPLDVGFLVSRLASLRLDDGTSLVLVGSDRLYDEEAGRRYGVVQAWDLADGARYGSAATDHAGEINALSGTHLPTARRSRSRLTATARHEPTTSLPVDLTAHRCPQAASRRRSTVGMGTRLPNGAAIAAIGGYRSSFEDGIVQIHDLEQPGRPHEIMVPNAVMGSRSPPSTASSSEPIWMWRCMTCPLIDQAPGSRGGTTPELRGRATPTFGRLCVSRGRPR